MADGVPPFATYVPGADSDQNASRSQAVRAVTIHTTQGPDSRGIGASRHHDTPGTFNFLNRDDGLYCYYPAHVRCSHAAGANHAGPGIENEGHTGTPLSPNQIANLGRLAHWFGDTYGVPLTYRTGDPREWIDNTGFRGFIAHRAVDYPPNTSYRHFDEITPDEFAAAIGGATPAPIDTEDGDSMVTVYVNPQGTRCYFFVNRNGEFVQKTWNTPVPGQWNTLVIGGSARPGEKVLVDDKLDANLHLFSRSKDGRGMAHATYLNGAWVTQVD